MNVFQVLNRRSTTRFLSAKEKLNLMGTKLNQKSSIVPEKGHIHLSAKRASQFGVRVDSEEHEEIKKILRESMQPDDGHLNIHNTLTISTNNKFKRVFDTIMDLLPIVSIISSMYFMSFKSLDQPDLIFDNFIWVLFVIDFFLTFFSQYIDKKRRPVKNFQLIALNYMKSLMIPDLIALIPLRFAGHFRAECFLRLFRLPRVYNVFKLVNISTVSAKISKFIYKDQPIQRRKLKLKIYAMWSIFKQIMRIFFVSFIIASLWYSYVDYIHDKGHEENDFIVNFMLEEDDTTKRFIKTWYYIFTTLATVGYGDFYAVNKYEQGFAIVLLLAGPTWFAFAMGNAIAIINDMQDLSGKKANKAVLQKWLGSLSASFSEIPFELKDKISTHFSNLWKNDRLGGILNPSDEGTFDVFKISDPLYEQLPEKVRKLILEYLFSDVFYSHLIFFRCFSAAKYELSRFLQPRVYKKRSVILSYKSYVHELLLLTDGTVEISIHKDFDSEEPVHECRSYCKIRISQMNQKCIIGDLFAIQNKPSNFEFSALNTVKGFAIPVFAFKEILNHFKLNSKKYEMLVQPIYENINSILNDEMRSRPQETHEIDRFHVAGSKMMQGSEFNEKEMVEGQDCLYMMENKDSLEKEIECIENLLKDCNTRRRRLLSSLKEKIVETVFSRILF